MTRPVICAAILAISLTSSTGCTSLSDVGANMKKTARMFRPRPYDDSDEFEAESEDAWADMVREGRDLHEREREPDRFWWNKVMSPQARNIERNLGFE